jgi:hypothetical protein
MLSSLQKSDTWNIPGCRFFVLVAGLFFNSIIRRKTMKNAVVFILVGMMLYGLAYAGLNAMDKTFISGWRVVQHYDDMLVIELDKQLASGTDTACREVAKLVERLGQKGYKVQIINWHTDKILTLAWAEKALATDAKY